ncbi:MAG: RNA-binding protein [Spirochaetota bacterium]|nr:RNA-binding protein [Spirochaetota bacterium]
MSVNIYVGNLAYSMTEESLQELFEQHGEVSSVKIITDRETGRSKGFGFVEMSENADAENAIQQLNDTEVQGRNIRVNVARPRNS